MRVLAVKLEQEDTHQKLSNNETKIELTSNVRHYMV